MEDKKKISLLLFQICSNTNKCIQYFAETLYQYVMPHYNNMIFITWDGTHKYLQKHLLDAYENIYLVNDMLDDFDEDCIPVVFLSNEGTETVKISKSVSILSSS